MFSLRKLLELDTQYLNTPSYLELFQCISSLTEKESESNKYSLLNSFHS